MESRHATLGRRTLEEIRQKRAAERLSKAASGPDLTQIPFPQDVASIRKSESGNRLSETDVSGLVTQLKDMQRNNTDLEEEKRTLHTKLQAAETENGMLQKRLTDLEQNTVPSLRRALKDVAMEKDAAVVAREDLSAQLRTLKKRLKEAEEEQYRAEEDAAALRSELNSIQQQMMNGAPSFLNMPIGNLPNHPEVLENELAKMKLELQQVLALRQRVQEQFLEEQARMSALLSEKIALEEKVAVLSQKVSEQPFNRTYRAKRGGDEDWVKKWREKHLTELETTEKVEIQIIGKQWTIKLKGRNYSASSSITYRSGRMRIGLERCSVKTVRQEMCLFLLGGGGRQIVGLDSLGIGLWGRRWHQFADGMEPMLGRRNYWFRWLMAEVNPIRRYVRQAEAEDSSGRSKYGRCGVSLET